MLRMPDTPRLGRAFWKPPFEEKPPKHFQLSYLLDEADHQDGLTIPRFIQYSWIEALRGDEAQLQMQPINHYGLDHGTEMLMTFAVLVMMDHQVSSIINEFLPFHSAGQFYSRYLYSSGDCHDIHSSRALEAVLGDDDIHRKHMCHFCLGTSVYRDERYSCEISIALCDAITRFQVSLSGTIQSEHFWTSASHRATELCVFTYTHHPIHVPLFQSGGMKKWKPFWNIEIRCMPQRARGQACRSRYWGFSTSCRNIWSAMRRFGRFFGVKQCLPLCLFLGLSSIRQNSVPLRLKIMWVHSSSFEGRWCSDGITRNVNMGRDCTEGTKTTGSNSGEGRTSNKANSQQLQRPSTWPCRSSQKRSATAEGISEGNGDDEASGKKPHKRRRLDTDTSNPRFACPFFKHNPTKFIGERSCCGPGWINVQRVKEHIFRKHGAPEFQCLRCFTDFENESDLDEHRRSTVACEVRDRPSAPPRVDKGTMQLLKQRKKPTNPVTEMDKWYTVYKIIFPHETQVPSPYYELEEKGLTGPSENTAEEMFEKNLKDALPLAALANTGLMDLIMPGVMTAFNKTWSALQDQTTTVISEGTQNTTTATDIAEPWHESTGWYTTGQSSLQVDRMIKDVLAQIETRSSHFDSSHFDSATSGPVSSSSLDSVQSEMDTVDVSWQTEPDSWMPVGPSSRGWGYNLDPVELEYSHTWLPDHEESWGEEASRD